MNSHLAITQTISNQLTLIAGGSEEHCRRTLQAWTDQHPLPEHGTGLIVQIITTDATAAAMPPVSTGRRCPHPDHQQRELETVEALLLHMLEHQITLEDAMTEFANDQAHLDDDVNRLSEAFGAAVTELKAWVQNNPDLPASQLDFTKLDSLVGTMEAEAAADAQPAPTAAGATVAAPTTNQAANTGVGNDAMSAPAVVPVATETGPAVVDADPVDEAVPAASVDEPVATEAPASGPSCPA